jgi:hypothetical protein
MDFGIFFNVEWGHAFFVSMKLVCFNYQGAGGG